MAMEPGATERPPCLLVAGRAYGSALGIMRSLGRRGVSCHVGVLGEASPLPYAASRYCTKAQRLGSGTDEAVARSLLDWVRRVRPGVRAPLMPVSDDGCRAVQKVRGELERLCRPVLPDERVLGAVLDKTAAERAAERAGLRTPRAIAASTVSELEDRIRDLRAPFIVKPARPGSIPGLKAKVVRDPEACVGLARSLAWDGGELLVQEYVDGPDTSVFVYLCYRSRNTGRIVDWTGRKLRQSPPGAGIMAYGTSEDLPEVRRLGRSLVRYLGYSGVAGAEFKRDRDGYVFIEINPRFAGFHGLAARAGVDLAWSAYVDTALGQPNAAPKQHGATYLNGQTYAKVVLSPGGLRMALGDFPRFLRTRNRTWAVWNLLDPSPGPVGAAVEVRRAAGLVREALASKVRAQRPKSGAQGSESSRRQIDDAS